MTPPPAAPLPASLGSAATGDTRDHLMLAAANAHWVIELTIPMSDPETGEQRTAVVTIEKRRLWQTASGSVVRGVTVRWQEGSEKWG